jgi:hypothetical protein
VTSHLERYPNLRYIAQENDALRLLLWGEPYRSAEGSSPLPIHAGHPLFRDDKTRLFVDPWPWIDYMRDVDFTFGTRIHGNIAALLAGSPSYVFAHDTRTLELARYFQIPHRAMADVPATIDAAELYAEADYGPLLTGHPERYRRFIGYVEGHGLRHIFEPGEDRTEFDRRVATIAYPPPVRVRHPSPVHRARHRAGRLVRRIEGAAGRRLNQI